MCLWIDALEVRNDHGLHGVLALQGRELPKELVLVGYPVGTQVTESKLLL